VVNDIPPNCSVVGIPGKIVRTGPPQKSAFGIDLDHHLIPDPVGRAMTCMLERIVELERQLNEGKSPKKGFDPCPACEALDVCICEQTGEHCK
jgi:serine O-acetyltransferase